MKEGGKQEGGVGMPSLINDVFLPCLCPLVELLSPVLVGGCYWWWLVSGGAAH